MGARSFLLNDFSDPRDGFNLSKGHICCSTKYEVDVTTLPTHEMYCNLRDNIQYFRVQCVHPGVLFLQLFREICTRCEWDGIVIGVVHENSDGKTEQR